MAQDWRRAKEIFNEVLDLPDTERHDAIARLCGSDASLKGAVEKLLGAHDRANELLNTPIETNTAPSSRADSASPLPMPDRIGVFQILGRLGAGGFGVVYHGRQVEPVEREVAIKLLRRGFDDPTVRARFLAEQRALARMQHPNIARLLEVGTADGQSPFVAMELIRGEAITAFCNKRGLGLRERLGLFLDVCRAVHHAHQQAVIHCDLKPSNILVTAVDGQPTPKIIDFGIARRTTQTENSPDSDHSSEPIGTPRYMSPEQYQPDATPDIRFDVFALGVVLCEMLTGLTPYESTAPPRDNSSTVATPPSRLLATRPDAHLPASRLRGDLDAIVLRAVAWSPERRYESAAALAEDVRRHLTDEPVEAVAPTRRYRTVKFLRRHRRAAIAGAISAFALLGGAAASLIGLWLAIDARDEARDSATLARKAEESAVREADRSKQMLDFLLDDVIMAAEPEVALGNEIKLTDVLDEAIPFAQMRFADDRATLVRVLARIGHAYSALAKVEPAERALREALRLADESNELGDESRIKVQLELVHTLFQGGKNREAGALLDEVERLAVERLGPEHLLTLLANRSALKGKPPSPEKEAALRSICASLERQGLTESDAYVESMNSLVELLLIRGSPDALDLTHRAAASVERRYLPQHPAALFVRQLQAKALSNAQQHDRACETILLLLDDAKRIFSGSASFLSGYWHVAIEVHLNARRPADALRIAEEMIANVESEFGRDSVPYATAAQFLGRALFSARREAEAAAVLEECFEARKKQWGAGSFQIIGAGSELSRALIAIGQPERARELLVELREYPNIPPGFRAVADLLLVIAYDALDRQGDAAELLSQVTATVELARQNRATWVPNVLKRIAEYHRACGQAELAESYEQMARQPL